MINIEAAATLIKSRRKDCGLSVKEVIEKLKTYGIDISVKTLYSWESGQNRVSADEFMALCDIYHVESITELSNCSTFSYSPEEKMHIKKYRALDEHGKSNVDVLLENEYRHAMNYKTSGIACKIYLVPEYLQPASAGGGEWNDDDLTESLELLREPPKGTSYVVRVHGDSMKPTFRDGDRLFVRAQDTLDQGEIGIFNIDGEMFVKELRGKHLMSHNPAYEPIRLTESTRCQGKVLGVCDDSFFE